MPNNHSTNRNKAINNYTLRMTQILLNTTLHHTKNVRKTIVSCPGASLRALAQKSIGGAELQISIIRALNNITVNPR